MKKYLKYKFLISKIREYIFIFLTVTIFSLSVVSKSLSEENVFVIKDIKIKGVVDTNFSREKYINRAFSKSFNMLMSKILLSEDLIKFKNKKLSEIKRLVDSFQILEENYKKDQYEATFLISYNHKKVKTLLVEKNVPFSQPKNISVIFFPLLLVNGEIKNFNDNYFYNNWINVGPKNNPINFILPIEDLDDISALKSKKDNIEEINILNLVNKYNIENYVFALIDFNKTKLNAYIKTNFEGNEFTKNINYKLEDYKNEEELNLIASDLKMQITDIWKQTNIINLLMPLSIKIKFKHSTLSDLDKIKKTFNDIDIVENYVLEELNIDHSFFKIYYYGNPKRLRAALSKFGYELNDHQGHWEIY